MRRAIEFFEATTKLLHYVSGGLIVALMLLTVANIVGRWLWDIPVSGSVELTQTGMVAIVFLGLAYAQVQEDHIRVDLLYERLGNRGKTVLGLFAAVVSFATVAVVTWSLYDYVGVLEASNRTTSSLGIPLFYVGWLAAAGAAIYMLGITATAFRRSRSHHESSRGIAENER